jgi:hypothetical protein
VLYAAAAAATAGAAVSAAGGATATPEQPFPSWAYLPGVGTTPENLLQLQDSILQLIRGPEQCNDLLLEYGVFISWDGICHLRALEAISFFGPMTRWWDQDVFSRFLNGSQENEKQFSLQHQLPQHLCEGDGIPVISDTQEKDFDWREWPLWLVLLLGVCAVSDPAVRSCAHMRGSSDAVMHFRMELPLYQLMLGGTHVQQERKCA